MRTGRLVPGPPSRGDGRHLARYAPAQGAPPPKAHPCPRRTPAQGAPPPKAHRRRRRDGTGWADRRSGPAVSQGGDGLPDPRHGGPARRAEVHALRARLVLREVAGVCQRSPGAVGALRPASPSTAARSPGKRASRTARRRVIRRAFPARRVSVIPASRAGSASGGTASTWARPGRPGCTRSRRPRPSGGSAPTGRDRPGRAALRPTPRPHARVVPPAHPRVRPIVESIDQVLGLTERHGGEILDGSTRPRARRSPERTGGMGRCQWNCVV